MPCSKALDPKVLVSPESRGIPPAKWGKIKGCSAVSQAIAFSLETFDCRHSLLVPACLREHLDLFGQIAVSLIDSVR